MNLDTYLFNAIHQYAGKSKWLDALAIWCAVYLAYAILIFVGLIALITGQWQLFWVPLVAGLVARFAFNEVIYAIRARKRPCEALGFEPLFKKPKHPAFPSGHASFFFGFSFALLAFNPPLAIACMIAIAVVLLARIFCGVHWPSDMVAGVVMGIVASIMIWNIV